MPESSRNRRMRTRMSGGVGPVADLTVSHGDPIELSRFAAGFVATVYFGFVCHAAW
jgi:hypothetical protein